MGKLIKDEKGSTVLGELILFAVIATAFLSFCLGINNVNRSIKTEIKRNISTINYVR